MRLENERMSQFPSNSCKIRRKKERERENVDWEKEDFHIDWWIMQNVISFLTEGMFTFTGDGTEMYCWFLYICSDSITPCSLQWKKRCCGDSLAQWSQHQWKRCKKSLNWEVVEEMKWLSDKVNNYWNRDLRGRETLRVRRERELYFLFLIDLFHLKTDNLIVAPYFIL